MPNQVYTMSFFATVMLVIMFVLMTAIFLLALYQLFHFIKGKDATSHGQPSVEAGGYDERTVL